MDSLTAPKNVLVHIGPHQTGSAAIRNSLTSMVAELESADAFYLHSPDTRTSALDLANERFEQAEAGLAGICKTIGRLLQKNVILSHEDFSGELIGRSNNRAVYPTLTKNLRILHRSLRPHAVTFVFFRRNEADWLKSCYQQHRKYRARFDSFEAFSERFGAGLSWPAILEKPKDVFGENLVVLDCEGDPRSEVMKLIGVLSREAAPDTDTLLFEDQNPSPHADRTAQRERTEEMSRSNPGAVSDPLLPDNTAPASDAWSSAWPPSKSDTASCTLPALLRRTNARVRTQDAEDILPPVTVDLEQLAQEHLPLDVEMPNLRRVDIRHQSTLLDYRLRGKSRLHHLTSLVISYLRRDTPHTEKARLLFHRIWREKGSVLVKEMSVRWLISTLQTFLDHGENEAQRSIGMAGYFYGNMMKIYEGERAIEGLEQDAAYAQVKPNTKNRFKGLDRYTVGGTDLMLNTNALALEIALRDEVAGLVLQEFLLRVKTSENVFSRHDRTRRDKGISISGFKDAWTFFEPWED